MLIRCELVEVEGGKGSMNANNQVACAGGASTLVEILKFEPCEKYGSKSAARKRWNSRFMHVHLISSNSPSYPISSTNHQISTYVEPTAPSSEPHCAHRRIARNKKQPNSHLTSTNAFSLTE